MSIVEIAIHRSSSLEYKFGIGCVEFKVPELAMWKWLVGNREVQLWNLLVAGGWVEDLQVICTGMLIETLGKDEII